MGTEHIAVDTRRFVWAMCVTTLLLVAASVVADLWKYGLHQETFSALVDLFELGGEMNVPTFFSMLLLLGAALLLAIVTQLERARDGAMVSRWAMLTVGFVLMSYDEAFQMHERLVSPIHELIGERQHGVLYYSWVLPAMALVVLLALVFRRFLLSLSSRTRRRFLLGGVVYLSGAIGVELFEGRYADAHGDQTLLFAALSSLEETAEIVGVVIFITALLGHLGRTYGELRLTIELPQRTSPTEEPSE